MLPAVAAIMQWKFFKLGFNKNWALWFHMLGGIVVYQLSYLLGCSFWHAVYNGMVVAVGWEMIEVLWGMREQLILFKRRHPGHKMLFKTFVINNYGYAPWKWKSKPTPSNPKQPNYEGWAYDSLGDIVGTQLAGMLSMIFLLGQL